MYELTMYLEKEEDLAEENSMQTFRFEAIDRSLSPIDRLKGSGEIGLSIA